MLEPITVSQAALFLRLDVATSPIPEQDLIQELIIAARVAAENFLNRTIVERQRVIALDAFSDVIDLPNGDVSSVDTISYIDTDGVSQSVANSILSENRLTPAFGEQWPPTRLQLGAVTITYTAGYTPAGSPAVDTTPKNIVRAMYLEIGDMYDNREAISQGVEYRGNPTFENLLFPDRLDLGV